MKPSLHYFVVQQIVERDQDHSLMVGHEGFDENALLLRLQAVFRVIDGFIKAVPGESAFAYQPPHVFERRSRFDHRSKRGRVGRHNQVIAQPALESQTRDTKWTVLVIELQVAGVVRGLRDSPRNAALTAVLDLARNYGAVCLIEKRVSVAAHYQERHQVLEHSCRPGYQRAASINLGERAPQMKPVLL